MTRSAFAPALGRSGLSCRSVRRTHRPPHARINGAGPANCLVHKIRYDVTTEKAQETQLFCPSYGSRACIATAIGHRQPVTESSRSSFTVPPVVIDKKKVSRNHAHIQRRLRSSTLKLISPTDPSRPDWLFRGLGAFTFPDQDAAGFSRCFRPTQARYFVFG